jgi:hypothetical protein
MNLKVPHSRKTCFYFLTQAMYEFSCFPHPRYIEYTRVCPNTRWEGTQKVVAVKFIRLTHKITIQLHLVAESYTICGSRSRRPVRKLLDTLSYMNQFLFTLVPSVPHLIIMCNVEIFLS